MCRRRRRRRDSDKEKIQVSSVQSVVRTRKNESSGVRKIKASRGVTETHPGYALSTSTGAT